MTNEREDVLRLRSGLQLLARSLFVYAASAAASATSAGLAWSSMANRSASAPWQEAWGFGALLVAIALMFVAAVLFLLAFPELRAGAPAAGPGGPETIEWARKCLLVGGLAGVLGLAEMAAGGLPMGVIITGVGACSFLLAALLPVLLVGTRRDVVTAGVAMSLGILGIVEETAVTVALGWPSGNIGWAEFGGFPILNWNLPWGLAVAASAAILGWVHFRVYRRLRKGTTQGSKPLADTPSTAGLSSSPRGTASARRP